MRESWLLSLIGLMLAGPVLAQGNADQGKVHFVVCVACHGVNGEGSQALNAPQIAGQHAWYLVRQLQNFKTGIRGAHAQDTYGMQMAPMAMTLPDDAAVENVAAYIAALPPAERTPTLSGDATRGKDLYLVCATCHGQDGKGLEALNGPSLVVQQDWYLVRQINYYKAGIRGADAKDIYGMQMAPMAQTLLDEQAVLDVVAYIQTLK